MLAKKPPLFMSEVSSNHNRDLDRCLQFISTSAQIGCNAVKFQLFKINELFAPEILERNEALRNRKRWEMPVEFIPELSRYAHEIGLLLSCTPFYLKAVEELTHYVDFFKIASYELLWNPLLTACAQSGKPVVISTGMATLDEIEAAVGTLQRAGCQDLTVLHCVSAYPAPPNESNLSVIETLREKLNVPIGWSDHSVSPSVIYRAIHRFGAEMIEFHLDLDGVGEEFGSGHCWLPGKIEEVIRTARDGFNCDGDGIKGPAMSELSDRDWRADPEDGLRPLRKMRLHG